jgi:hypothetical protein
MMNLKEVVWNFAVPPENRIQIVITQRQDGPFRSDPLKGPGHYYVSAERYVGTWEHIVQSTQGAFRTYEECIQAGTELARAYQERATSIGSIQKDLASRMPHRP